MKRFFVLLLAVVMLLALVSCSKAEPEESKKKLEHHEMVTDAIKLLKEHWQEFYEESEVETDRYFEIKNTRVITLKDNDIEFANIQDIAYIVEFVIYSDYWGSAPYYSNAGLYDEVVVYKDGEMEMGPNIIRQYRNKTYNTDFSDFIASVDDYGDAYNCTRKLQ